jgi:leucyl aminopeptidase
MKVISGKGKIENSRADALALMFLEDELKLSRAGKFADRLGKGSLSRVLKARFKGKKDEAEVVPLGKDSPFGLVVLLGLGPRARSKGSSGLDAECFRRAAGAMVNALSRYQARRVHAELVPEEFPSLSFHEMAQGFVEGAVLRSYRYSEYKKPEDAKAIDTLVLFSKGKNIDSSLRQGRIVAEEVNFVRELINMPGNELPPLELARIAEKSARELKFSCRTYKQTDLKRMGYNAILAVGQGSTRPPCLVVLHYKGGKKKTLPFVFVGKGITFDSGGISIKPSADMDKMKYDMAGAAAVLGAIRAAARLSLKANVDSLLPLAENLPGGGAERPGDIIRTAAGVTVEVANTDAEGRLVLADALHHAVGLKPRAIIDLATLTGAAVVVVGSQAIPLMGNNEELLARVSAAGVATGERTWLLPLWDEYEDLVKSEVADIRNIGAGREAGTIVGGMFLKRFVKDMPWAHLDIASTAWTDKAHPYLGIGPTGKGTRLLVRLLEDIER